MTQICENCYHECHCRGDLHADEYGVCVCDNCECEDGRIQNSKRASKKSSSTGKTSKGQN